MLTDIIIRVNWLQDAFCTLSDREINRKTAGNRLMPGNYPKWNSVCFPFFPFPFFPPDGSPSSLSVALADVVPDAGPGDGVQALCVGRLSSQRTVPRVRPAIRTFGFGAFGRAGKASALFALGRGDDAGAREEERLPGNDGEGAAVPQAVAGVLDDRAEEPRGGNGLAEELDPGSAPVLPTADREDCAVDDFKRRTRLPPEPLPLTVLGDIPGRMPLGPGKAG